MFDSHFEVACIVEKCVGCEFSHNAHFINTFFGIVSSINIKKGLSTPLFKDKNICIYASTPNMADWVENFEIVYQIVRWIARNEALPCVINHGLSHYVHNIWDSSVFDICRGRNIEEFYCE